MLTLGDGVMRGVFPGKGVLAGPPCDKLGSSEKILPIEESGRWMVRSRPPIAAFSSKPSPLSYSLEDVDFRGMEDSPSIECLGVTSGRLRDDFSEKWVDKEASAFAAWCFSAMAETAASTLCSKSSSEIVRLVRSKFSIN